MNKPDIFCIHGWGADLRCWQTLADDLGGRYRLTMIELPGHGANIGGAYSLSEPTALTEWLLSMAPPRAIWLGWSLGSLLAQLAASRSPQRVESLISLGMGAYFAHAPDWQTGTARSALRKMKSELRINPKQCLEAFATAQIADDKQGHHALPTLEAMISAPFELEELIAGLELLETLDMRKTVERLSVPILFVAGANDRISSADCLKASARLARQGQYAEVPDAGHAALLSHPGAVLRCIDQFVDSSNPDSSTQSKTAE